jgi:hypothetical protein
VKILTWSVTKRDLKNYRHVQIDSSRIFLPDKSSLGPEDAVEGPEELLLEAAQGGDDIVLLGSELREADGRGGGGGVQGAGHHRKEEHGLQGHRDWSSWRTEDYNKLAIIRLGGV